MKIHGRDFQPTGFYSFIGIYLLLLGLTYLLGQNYNDYIHDLANFFRGNVISTKQSNQEILATMLFTVVLILTVNSFLSLILPEATAYKINEIINIFTKEHGSVLPIVALEEIIFRYVLIGIPIKNLHLTGVQTIILILASSVLFALAHLSNYKQINFTVFLRISTHLVSALLLAYLFIACGLITAIAGHFIINMTIVAFLKEQEWKQTILFITPCFIFTSISFFLIRYFDIEWQNWLLSMIDGNITDKLSFWECSLLIISLNYLMELLANIFLLDIKEYNFKPELNLLEVVAKALIIASLVYVLNLISTLFIHFNSLIATLISILLNSFVEVNTGSHFTRRWLFEYVGIWALIANALPMGIIAFMSLFIISFIAQAILQDLLRVKKTEPNNFL